MKGLFEMIEGVEGNREAYQSDDRGGPDDAEMPRKELKRKGNRSGKRS